VHFGLENASSESKFRAHSRKICLSLVCLQAGHYYRRQLTDYREFIIKINLIFFPFWVLSSPTLSETHFASCLKLTGRPLALGSRSVVVPVIIGR